MLLALDTATDTIGLALTDGARILAEEVWLARRHATVELAPETARLLRRTGAREDQLQGIAITIGPGSYTGLRIGLAFAKGLAFGPGGDHRPRQLHQAGDPGRFALAAHQRVQIAGRRLAQRIACAGRP